MIIYKITNNTNGKIYIGQTVRTLEERIGEHKRHINTMVGKAFRKYGVDKFTIEIIDKAKTITELNKKEIKWVSHFDCLVPKGYNQCYGGDNSIGFHHREESRREMSKKKSDMYLGKSNPFYGKTHSEEQRAKWSKERKETHAEYVAKAKEASLVVRMRRIRNLGTGETFNSVKEAAEKYNLKATHITRVCRGKRKHTGGFGWEYID